MRPVVTYRQYTDTRDGQADGPVRPRNLIMNILFLGSKAQSTQN